MSKTPHPAKTLQRLFFGKSAIAGMTAWLMMIAALIIFQEYINFGQYTFAEKMDRPYTNFYHLMFSQNWREKFTPNSLMRKFDNNAWEEPPDTNLSLAILRGALLRRELRGKYPEIFTTYMKGLMFAGNTSYKEWELFFNKLDEQSELDRSRRKLTANSNPLESRIDKQDTLVIFVKGSGLASLSGPVIRLVVDYPLNTGTQIDHAELPVMRWCFDDKGDLPFSRYRELTWRILPGAPEGKQRREFLIDMSWEPQWLNPKSKPRLFITCPQISTWKIVQLESLEIMPTDS